MIGLTWKSAHPVLLGLLLAGCITHGPGENQRIAVSGPIEGTPVFNAGQYSLADLGYVRQEYFFSGVAASYRSTGTLSDDGEWTVTQAGTAPFVSRLVVIRPFDSSRFNGTVVLEWLNVTSGGDVAPEWTYLHRELIREGYAYAGVSAQRASVEGGPGMFSGGTPLKRANPARYAPLHHPGDAFSYDIFSQAGRVVRGAGSLKVLGPLQPKRVIAAGESQSALFLTTYVNAVAPLGNGFDGYLIHSRFGFAAGLSGAMDGRTEMPLGSVNGVRIRGSVSVPVMIYVTETDVIGPNTMYLRARQPDTSRIRTWEVAGAAHADNYVFSVGAIDSGSGPIERLAAAWKPMATVVGMPLDVPINAGPQHHYVALAALRQLNRWIVAGETPSKAQRLDVAPGAEPQFAVDRNGNALGGVRSPWVDAPAATLSGSRKDGAGLLALLGATERFSPAKLRSLYPGGKPDYLAKFNAALDSSIQAGFILKADEGEIKALAAALYPGR
jgi:hypothetical protein